MPLRTHCDKRNGQLAGCPQDARPRPAAIKVGLPFALAYPLVHPIRGTLPQRPHVAAQTTEVGMNRIGRRGMVSAGAAFGAFSVVTLAAAPAWATGSATSDSSGGHLVCNADRRGAGFVVNCNLSDTAADGYYVRIEWHSGSQSGKDNNTGGISTVHEFYAFYAFPNIQPFVFKVVTDRGIYPDITGDTRTLNP